jgi:ferredoxin
MKVVVNRDNCIGCGACEALYPELFQIDDEGLSTVLENENIEEEKLTEVVEGCPTSAINKVEE